MNAQLRELGIAYAITAVAMLAGLLLMRADRRAYFRWPVYSAMAMVLGVVSWNLMRKHLLPAEWTMTHSNGSHIEGYVVKPDDTDDYGHYRDIGVYRPFPEGVWSSIKARDAEGVGIINEIGVIWARHIGVPCPFKQPVKVFIEKGQIKKFEGGAEAETLTRFYQFIAKYLGDAAYEVRGFHGGVHPSAILEPHQCPNAPYRHFIEHHHWSSFHFHMGNSRRSKTFPYLMHISAELRGGDLKIGEKYVYKDGRITTAEHPKVRAIAGKYKDRPGLEPEKWLQTPR